MNSIKLQSICDGYLDVTRNARYQRIEYDNAFNSAQKNFIDSITGTPDNPVSGFQLNQAFNDNLYTLQKTQSAAPTLDVALFPTDYRTLDSIFVTIGGQSIYCRPITQNRLGPTQNDSYITSADDLPYYLQNLTGFKIYHGAGTITNVDLNYVKTPLIFTIGKDSQLINAGVGVLTLATSYIATQPSVQNSVEYNIGDQFTAAGSTTLTSGQVILASNTVTLELPEKVQEIIAKMACAIISGEVSDYQKSAFAEKEAKNS